MCCVRTDESRATRPAGRREDKETERGAMLLAIIFAVHVTLMEHAMIDKYIVRGAHERARRTTVIEVRVE